MQSGAGGGAWEGAAPSGASHPRSAPASLTARSCPRAAGLGAPGWPHTAPQPRAGFGISRVGTEGLLGGLGVVFTWQSHAGRGFSAFPPCLKSEATQRGGIFLHSGFVKAQLSEA